ncbi:MAG: asparaginase [Oscillospiraceae bacterium]|nr:asparaginase [Oscillospiraceae bacterium]
MPRILLITTGGTIACPDKKEARSPESSADGFVNALSGIDCEITAVEPFCLDSTDMTPRHYLELSRIIRVNYDNFDGFVITHGTDTMAYAAAALSCLVVNSRKPIVITGSMKPFSAENSDAHENLRNAFIFALDARAHGAAVVFGRFAFDGRRVTKIHTTAKNAFESVGFPPVAAFENNKISFTEPVIKHSGEVFFHEELDERIEVIYLVPGVSPPVVRKDTRAAVILGFGTGGFPAAFEDFLKQLVDRGVYIIMSTQVLRGGTNLSLYETGSRIMQKYPVIEAGKMNTEYLTMKAMVSLSLSDSFEEFRKNFLNNN